MTDIAIITPVYNGRFIGECIDSVAAVVVRDFKTEHIVVDDGSTDGAVNSAMEKTRPGLRVLGYAENRGGAFARNYGIDRTEAELIFCLDADDVIFQNTVFSLVSFLKKNNYDWVYGDFLRTDESLRYKIGNDYYGYKFSNPEEVLTAMLSGEHFFQQNCLYRRSVFEAAGKFDEKRRHFQDFDLFGRFLLAGYMPQYLPGPLYLHRSHESNLSRLNLRETDPDLHRQDVRDWFTQYESQIKKRLSAEQLQKVAGYIN
jgi:glycosyltransferase involved in cell wall biosynthesis